MRLGQARLKELKGCFEPAQALRIGNFSRPRQCQEQVAAFHRQCWIRSRCIKTRIQSGARRLQISELELQIAEPAKMSNQYLALYVGATLLDDDAGALVQVQCRR